jgi:hypothetical protein
MLSTSRLCQSDAWPTDIDEMAALYRCERDCLFARLISSRQFVRLASSTLISMTYIVSGEL